ncbi:MAG: hypothetical protein K6U78_16630, partial [Anaerolineae bacterium]|nr:hypothetical protein [Anaerolineae bacterium]
YPASLDLAPQPIPTRPRLAKVLATQADPHVPQAPGALIGSGNALRRNALLREAISQRFGLPVRVPEWEEEAAVGAAMIATRLSP